MESETLDEIIMMLEAEKALYDQEELNYFQAQKRYENALARYLVVLKTTLAFKNEEE